ncbi:MAG: GDSL-type esterase/lipase family protein [Planctomycetota bacterium]|nr:GDSL-type esterase/lipase family protein [Planctomycetota bacterium]
MIFKCSIAFLILFATSLRADTTEPDVRFTGRWVLEKHEAPWCAWQGSSFLAAFEGSGVFAELESDAVEYLRVIVDGDHVNSKKLKLKPGKHEYVLAQKLGHGKHLVEVVKETYAHRGKLRLHGVSAEGGKLLPVENEEQRIRIQFYGDSNLSGHSLGHEKNEGAPEFAGCHFTFAGIASRMLDAEYQNISVGGATILGQQNSVLAFMGKNDYYEDEPSWDFSRFVVDIVVLNVGANDINRRDKTEIKRNYLTLLRKLRSVHRDSHIVVMNGYGWDRKETANYTSEVLEEFGDENSSRVVFPWLFNEWHGCEYDHAGMAKTLVNHLKSINADWGPIREMDVMDGFGRGGHVANGSFEHAAPFGGFGWRYAQDGARRIHAPDDSAEGDWYLHLPQGTQVHQPNPATVSNTYTFKMKLRSPNSAKAKLRIEFRDQQYRNELKELVQELTVQPGTAWQEFSIEAQTPKSSGDHSRDPWQVILRIEAAEETIDCDEIQLYSRR